MPKLFHYLALALMFLAFSGWPIAQAQAKAAEETLPVSGANLTIVWSDDFSESEQQSLRTWVKHSVQGVLSLYGKFPIPEARIQIRRASRGSGPVPWGQVLRGSPDGILLVVNPNYPLSAMINDWTAAHEFSHLFIPYPGDRDIWFTEGLATYLQNVLMARNGSYSEQTAWQKLYDGFMRGDKQAKRNNTPLREASPSMWATRSYMRVYWTGAAYFLLADTRLRQQTGGRTGLAEVLAGFADCCLNDQQMRSSGKWNARSLAKRFDRIAESQVFSTLYDEIINDTEMPAWPQAFDWLGIDVKDGQLSLSMAAPYAERRAGIMTATGQASVQSQE